MIHHINIAGSVLTSTLRGWRGTGGSTQLANTNSESLILFDCEGSPECRIVRETLTALNFDITIVPCPIGGKNLASMQKESGFKSVPVLYDAQTEAKRQGADEIIQYLYQQYRNGVAPPKALQTWRNTLLSKLASVSRFNAGIYAKPARHVAQPLTLYSFESSPYSRPVRELLCELEIPYRLVNLGKQQWSDMGPAKARLTLKPYRPLKGSKREAFMEKYGDVQVPFIVDPNTGVQMFESKDILGYLKDTYWLEEV